MKCDHCGKECGGETVAIKRKWVSWGPVAPYDTPVVKPCHKACKSAFMDERAKYFAVLDETMNTHRDFVRVEGQRGYVATPAGRVDCQGWQTSGEVGVEYHPSDRYKDYA